VIGCEDRLRNDLYCVEWGVKLYSNSNSKPAFSSRVGYKTTTVRSRPIHTASAARRDEATYIRACQRARLTD